MTDPITTRVRPAHFGRTAFASHCVNGKRVGEAKEFSSHAEAVEYALRRATEIGAQIDIVDVLNVSKELFASILPHLTEQSLGEVAQFSSAARAFKAGKQ